MNGFVFAPETNEPGKRDADEFRREARKFAAQRGIAPERIRIFPNDAPRKVRRQFVTDALIGFSGLDCVAFFCHGWRDGIQAGFSTAHMEELARVLYESCKPGARIPLYCCSTAQGAAGGDGGFADALRDELVGKLPGAVIDAHDRAGHTTQNPYVRRFVVGEFREKGGAWVVDPVDSRFPVWRRMLRETDLRFDFPFMSQAQIRAEIGHRKESP